MFNNVEELEKQVQEFQDNILASNKLIEGINGLTVSIKQQQEELSSSMTAYQDEVKVLVDSVKLEAEALQSKTKEAIGSLSVSNDKMLKETASRLSDSVDKRVQKMEDSSSKAIEGTTKRLEDAQREYLARAQEIESNMKHTAENVVASADERIRKMEESSFKAIEETTARLENAQQLFLTRAQEIESNLEHTTENAVASVVKSQQECLSQMQSTQTAVETMHSALNQKYQDFLDRLETTNVDQLFKVCQDIKESTNKKFLILLGSVGVVGILALLSLILH